MATPFALDIDTVKKVGVDEWRRTFSWPVPDQEFIALANAIEARVRETIARVGGDIGLAFLIARGLPIAVDHILHARAVVDRIRAVGAMPMCSPGAQWYAEILNDPQPRRVPTVPHTVPARSFWVRPAIRMVRWGREIAANAAIPKALARCRNGKNVSLCGSTHPFLAEQLSRSPEWISTFYVDECAPAPVLSRVLHDDICAIAVTFVDDCVRDAARCGFPSDTNDAATLRDITVASLFNAAQTLQRMRAFIAAHSIAHGYLSAASNDMQRAFAIAVRERGGRITSMAHGGGVGLFNTPTRSCSEFAISDTFVTYTDGSADLSTRIQLSHPTIVPNTCKIISGVSTVYRRMRSAMSTRSPRSIRTVMVIGFPQNAQRKSTAAAAFGLQQLDIECRLIDTLRVMGYAVLYKAHPDRLKEIHGVFCDRATVITEDFQTAHRFADVFIFGSMHTSSFALALCTQKPIVAMLVDGDPFPPFADALALLSRRVALVHAVLNEHARAHFDPTAIREGLERARDLTDDAFFDTYLTVPRVP